jgi:hypothetical protein
MEKKAFKRIEKTPADNERFGASGSVARLTVCADLQVFSPPKPL